MASTFPQIRILHLSDLHFGSNHICNHDANTGSGNGMATMKDLICHDLCDEEWSRLDWANQSSQEPTPLVVAVTGDLTQNAELVEFDQAHDFLMGLTEAPLLGTKIRVRDIFAVPGNHDVVFARHEAAHRFGPYCQFYNKIYQSIQPIIRPYTRPDDASSLSRIYTFPENRFLIAEINSCFHVEKDTVDQSRGQVDQQAIAGIRSQLESLSSEAKDWIKIAIVHHHPVLLPSFIEPGRGVDAICNARSLLRLLRDHRFQLILHGHKHFPQIFSYDPDSAWMSPELSIPQLIVAGGSSGSSSLPDGTQQCNTYNLITVKWNPKALQARIQVVTRGLIRMGAACGLDPDQWHWKTLRIFDKTLSPFANSPLLGPYKRQPFPDGDDALEKKRKKEYNKLRFNMPVVEVLPSLIPGQGYEARVWLVRHRNHKESPIQVIWSAGEWFSRKISDSTASPNFCTSFHYWGPMLIQAQLQFSDGVKATAYVYARLPDEIRNR